MLFLINQGKSNELVESQILYINNQALFGLKDT